MAGMGLSTVILVGITMTNKGLEFSRVKCFSSRILKKSGWEMGVNIGYMTVIMYVDTILFRPLPFQNISKCRQGYVWKLLILQHASPLTNKDCTHFKDVSIIWHVLLRRITKNELRVTNQCGLFCTELTHLDYKFLCNSGECKWEPRSKCMHFGSSHHLFLCLHGLW